MSPLNLFDEWPVVFERVEKTSSGYALSGHLALRPLSSVTIVVNGDDVAGVVNSDQGTWHVKSRGAGLVEIRKQEETFRCGTQPAVGESRRSRSGARKAAAAQDDEDEIDVLVVFTEAARRRDGGFAKIRANIDLAVAVTNEAYRASGVRQRVNLVGAVQVDYRESEKFGKGWGLSNQDEDRRRLESESDGYMDEVHALRDSYAADIVYLIVDQQGGGGVGWLLSLEDPNPAASAFAVSNSLGEYPAFFPHELGHVMGLNHDRYTDGTSCRECSPTNILDNKPYPYSYGYVNQEAFADGASEAKRWRTIMSYDSQCRDADMYCREIMRFSNPDQRYPAGHGDPLGVAGDKPSDADDGPADAVRSLNNTRSIVANFRPSSTRCAYELSRTEHAVADGGGSFSIRVNTETRCTWSAQVLDGFLSVDSSKPQRGNGEVVYHVEPNQGIARIGFITLAGETLAIYQSGTRAFTSVCDRTAAVRDALVLAAKRSDCSAVTESDLSNISHLDLSGEGITALKAGDFDSLVNLGVLNLTSNRITSLPASVFQDLINLRLLNLAGLNVTHLPTGIFANLSNLNELWLSDTNLTELSKSVFSGLTKLEWLFLMNNKKLRSLPDGVFSDLESLSYLILQQNQLSGLRKETFEGLPTRLAQLSLSYNPLTTLPEDLFSDMEIGQLFLDDTQLTQIPPRLFRNISRLWRLHLNDNQIARLDPRVFPGSDIQILEMRNNMLQQLPDELFLGFTSEFCLQRNMHLDLRDNPGAPFPLDLELVRLDADPAADGPAAIAVRVAEATPLPLTVGLSGHGGRLSATEATVPAGSVLSESIAVAGDGPVIVRLSGQPELPVTYKGITIELGEPLRLFALEDQALKENGAPFTLDKLSVDEQQAAAGAVLAEPFLVSVRDQNGVALPGIVVTFAITAGDGTLSVTRATTDAEGRAATTLTLGRTPGTNTVTATVAGLEPVTFTAIGQATTDSDGEIADDKSSGEDQPESEEQPTSTVGFEGISVSHDSIRENDEQATTITLTVTLDKAAAADETITLAIVSPTQGKTAKRNEDFDATLPETLTVAKGQRTGTAQLTLTPKDNTTADGDKAFAVQATSSSGHAALINIRIIDNDAAGEPQAWLTPNPAEVEFYADDPAWKTFTVHTNLDSVLVRANPSGSDPAIEVSGGQQVPTRDFCPAEGNDRPTRGAEMDGTCM